MSTFSSNTMKQQILVIGVGNEYRGDDGIGIILAREIAAKSIAGVVVAEEPGEGTLLMSCWEQCERVILIDAVQTGTEPGKIYQLDASSSPIAKNFFNYSSHNFSVAEAVELSKTLKRLPKHFLIIGVEGKSFAAGNRLSDEVREKIPDYLGIINNAITELSAR